MRKCKDWNIEREWHECYFCKMWLGFRGKVQERKWHPVNTFCLISSCLKKEIIKFKMFRFTGLGICTAAPAGVRQKQTQCLPYGFGSFTSGDSFVFLVSSMVENQVRFLIMTSQLRHLLWLPEGQDIVFMWKQMHCGLQIHTTLHLNSTSAVSFIVHSVYSWRFLFAISVVKAPGNREVSNFFS